MDRGPQSGKISGLNLEPKRKAFKIHIRSQACPIFFVVGTGSRFCICVWSFRRVSVFCKIYILECQTKASTQMQTHWALPPTSRFHQTIAIKFFAALINCRRFVTRCADKTNIHHSIYLNFRWFCESADLVVFHSIRYLHSTQAKPFISFICGCFHWARLNGKENASSMYFPFCEEKETRIEHSNLLKDSKFHVNFNPTWIDVQSVKYRWYFVCITLHFEKKSANVLEQILFHSNYCLASRRKCLHHQMNPSE